jgi:uncharacterized protein with GYD domain
MPKFLIEATYTAEGHKGLAKDKASGRKTAITQAVKKLGGKLDAIYFCLGENDVILIAGRITSARPRSVLPRALAEWREPRPRFC